MIELTDYDGLRHYVRKDHIVCIRRENLNDNVWIMDCIGPVRIRLNQQLAFNIANQLDNIFNPPHPESGGPR